MSTVRILPLAVFAIGLLFGGCSLPRVPVRQTFDRTATMTAGATRIYRYDARDPRTLDSSARILRMEYLPVSLFTVVDDRDSIASFLVVAWQELLWRFSERLSATDKEYYAPLPLGFVRSADSLVVTWGYPSLDTRDDDLRSITPYRNSYWSVDFYRTGATRDEVFQGDIRSYPQYERYDPLARFVPGGTYARAFGDSTPPYRALRSYVSTTIATNGADTVRRH
jgi:hypothetical protein